MGKRQGTIGEHGSEGGDGITNLPTGNYKENLISFEKVIDLFDKAWKEHGASQEVGKPFRGRIAIGAVPSRNTVRKYSPSGPPLHQGPDN